MKKQPRGRPRIHKSRVLTGPERCKRYRNKLKKAQKVYWRHDSDLWATPQAEFDKLHVEFGLTIDVCATPENAKLPRYYTPQQDGLEQDWSGEIVFCNPPYSVVAKWIAKAYEASKAGATVVCVTYAKVDTRWWHAYVEPYAEYR